MCMWEGTYLDLSFCHFHGSSAFVFSNRVFIFTFYSVGAGVLKCRQ